MARKKYFLTIDTETTQTNMVADFGAVISDKQGNIHQEIGILVADFFGDKDAHPLFHLYGDANDIFSKARLPERYADYEKMLQSGQRMLASVSAINRWLGKALAKYSPVLTAYNLAFDLDKCNNSGIILDGFSEKFCLMKAAQDKWANSRGYAQFCLDNHEFNNRTKTGAMTMRTKADTMARYLFPHLPHEPHTALEDARDYEVPILTELVKNTSPKVYMNAKGTDWRNLQIRDLFKPR